MKKLLTAAAMVGVIGLSGCASTNAPVAGKPVSVVPSEKVFEYQKNMPTGQAITPEGLVESLEEHIIEASGVRTLEEAARYRSASSDSVHGLKVMARDDSFDLYFINGEQFTDGGRIFGTAIGMTYAFAIEDAGDRLRLVVTTPSEYVIERGKSPLGFGYDPLFSGERAKQEIKRINNGLEPALTFTETVSGEVASPWEPQSVKGNFERLLTKEADSGKYLLKTNDEVVELDIKIFAYRDGSMVEYEFPYHYAAKGDGSVTFSQAEVDALIKRIEEVATN